MSFVSSKPIAVIAIGGNSLTRPGERSTFGQQQARARATCEGIADVLDAGYRVVLTHGNGPQVGDALLRAELSQPDLPPLRLDECDAETQGTLGYLLQQTLTSVLRDRGRRVAAVTIVTQVVVDPQDPAFHNPTKPIGPFYSVEEALERKHKLGWTLVEDAGRGWRRVVSSPRPLEVVELHAIRACLRSGVIVIAAGGGGIPVVRRNGTEDSGWVGVEAVIDKDRVSSLLARLLHARLLLFSTGVDRVAIHYGRPDQKNLDVLTCEQAQQYLRDGEFPPGSMGPKMEAAVEFLRSGEHKEGKASLVNARVIITSPDQIGAAIRGKAGTEILHSGAASGRFHSAA